MNTIYIMLSIIIALQLWTIFITELRKYKQKKWLSDSRDIYKKNREFVSNISSISDFDIQKEMQKYTNR